MDETCAILQQALLNEVVTDVLSRAEAIRRDINRLAPEEEHPGAAAVVEMLADMHGTLARLETLAAELTVLPGVQVR
ncbi:hypothetical protein KC902_03625 [Candidatus Kaiserbacteria bacterium]|nr:hypothetical protein [Candidatus Kaiserbacteria bacterium]USN89208.1 MAG: hypothetical protein H6780_02210 [Candidatus Nomurabacteria bacterium]